MGGANPPRYSSPGRTDERLPVWAARARPYRPAYLRCLRRRRSLRLRAWVAGRGLDYGDSFSAASALDVQGVRLLQAAHDALAVGGLLQQRFRIPLAARDAEEVAAVDVDGAGQAWNGIDD